MPKEQERTVVNEDDAAVETEWDEILTAASEEELVDLAGICTIIYLILFACVIFSVTGWDVNLKTSVFATLYEKDTSRMPDLTTLIIVISDL